MFQPLQLTVEQIFLLASTVKCFREGSQTSENVITEDIRHKNDYW